MRKGDDSEKKIEITEQMKEIVLARIDAQVPSNLKLSVGSAGGMNKEQIMEHIRKGDDIGRQIVQAHLRFLRAQSNGKVTTALVSAE